MQKRLANDWFADLHSVEKDILLPLRELLLDVVPELDEKLSYGAPFYFRNRRMFFLWPGSIPWGGFTEGVQLGFCQGIHLSDPNQYLTFGTRKQIGSLHYTHPNQIDEAIVLDLVAEAVTYDEFHR